jgi:hypothetical protein
MYAIDDQDTVVELKDVPQSCVGAPCPMILCGEHFLHLVYILEADLGNWDGTNIRVLDANSPGETCALVHFEHVEAHMFGPPNDEAFHGHPLSRRGLRPYSVNEIRKSSWIRKLERMNSIHPYHRPEAYLKLKHFIFAFHDTTFECVAEGFELSLHWGSVSSVLRASWPEG